MKAFIYKFEKILKVLTWQKSYFQDPKIEKNTYGNYKDVHLIILKAGNNIRKEILVGTFSEPPVRAIWHCLSVFEHLTQLSHFYAADTLI